MTPSQNVDLYKELFLHIYNMNNEVEYKERVIAEARQRRKQLPNVSVGAEYNGNTSLVDHHGRSEKNDFHPTVYNQLTQLLGPLNVTSQYCNNRIGHCAENYAASGVCKKAAGDQPFQNPLSDIAFTDAIQPRTWKMMDWCANCHKMYDE